MIKISVVTIVRNDCKNIEKTMLSVLGQSYTNYEYIVKDGFSEDGTQNIIEKVCLEYPDKKIKYVSSKDAGIYNAMNQAVKYCEAEWVIFINSGDLFYNNNVLKEIFDNNKLYKAVDVLFGDAIVSDESGDAIWRGDITKISRQMPFCHQSCFVRKELLVQNPFNTEFRIAADYNNILDIYVRNKKFYNVKKIVSIFRLDGVSSTEYVNRCKERNMVICRHGMEKRSGLVLFIEITIQYLKGYIEKIIPKKILLKLKRWYKKHIKRYETVDEGVAHENCFFDTI